MDPNADIYAALELIQDAEFPLIAMLGDRSRTWFVDHEQIQELFALLGAVREDIVLVHAGKFPFDPLVDRFAEEAGICSGLVGPRDWHLRLEGYERPMAVLDGAVLLVVFAPEQTEAALVDPLVCEALESGTPVLTIYRESPPVLCNV